VDNNGKRRKKREIDSDGENKEIENDGKKKK